MGKAFRGAFEALGVSADDRLAARRCSEVLGRRVAFPGTTEILAKLAARYRLGVLSNADHDCLQAVIANNGWSSDGNSWAFCPIVSSESARAYKPDPRIFARFCQEANVAPEEVLYVGDSLYDDVHGAKLAGMRVAWVKTADPVPWRTLPPDHTELLPPDVTITSLPELEQAVLSL